MNVARRVAYNTIALASSHIVIKISNFVFTIFLARFIGAQDFGKYSFIAVLYAMLSLFANFGLDTLIIRDIARDKSHAALYLWNSVAIKLVVSFLIILFVGGMFGFTSLLNDPTKRACLVIACLIMAFNCPTQTFWAYTDAFERMGYHAGLNVFYNIMRMAAGLLIVYRGHGLVSLFLGLLSVEVVTFLLTVTVVKNTVGLPPAQMRGPVIKKLISDTWPFALIGVLGLVYFRVDVLILSALRGDEPVGWYSAAYAILVGIMFVPDSLVSALFPVLSRYFESSEKSLKLAYQKSVKYLFILGLPLAAGIIMCAERVIVLLYGKAYLSSVPALQFLGAAVLLVFINAPLGRILFSMNKQRTVLFFSLVTVTANIVLNVVLIPKLSYIGCSITTVISELLSALIFFSLLARLAYVIDVVAVVAKPVIACTAMILFMVVFRALNLFLLSAGAALVYGSALYAVGVLDADDEYLFKRIFQRAE
ncbi:MAG: flippase [Candidatus Omnitrophica bacterium]|nr:flippase [Candidatus Omnitrophota bacterium]